MAQHSVSMTVNAPVSMVYELFSRFEDFPQYMSFVKEVSPIGHNTSHWVVDIAGLHDWDAVGENWQKDRQIGWRSVDGLENSGLVTFERIDPNRTEVRVTIDYVPPAGIFGDIAENLGTGRHFELALEHDLKLFAEKVNDSTWEQLDPTSSEYLFQSPIAAGEKELLPESTSPSYNAYRS